MEWVVIAAATALACIPIGSSNPTSLAGPHNDAAIHHRNMIMRYGTATPNSNKMLSTEHLFFYGIIWTATRACLGLGTAFFFNREATSDKDVFVPFMIFTFMNYGFLWTWLTTQRDYSLHRVQALAGMALFATSATTMALALTCFSDNVVACVLLIIWVAMCLSILYTSYMAYFVTNSKIDKQPWQIFSELGFSTDPTTSTRQTSSAAYVKVPNLASGGETQHIVQHTVQMHDGSVFARNTGGY